MILLKIMKEYDKTRKGFCSNHLIKITKDLVKIGKDSVKILKAF